jgi:hypothetical protein
VPSKAAAAKASVLANVLANLMTTSLCLPFVFLDAGFSPLSLSDAEIIVQLLHVVL